MGEFIIIMFIVVGVFFFFALLISCFIDTGTGSSNGFQTRNNRSRNSSYNSRNDEWKTTRRWENSSNDDFDDSDDAVWAREDY